MSKWIMIISDAEDKWMNSAESRSVSARCLDAKIYKRERDIFKARYIYETYEYDYFLRFVERCPHIQDLIKEYLPCNQGEQNCNIFCNFYKGGCMLCQ